MRYVKRVPDSGNAGRVRGGRGEFTVRLATVSTVYVVEATAPGFTRDTDEIRLAADERKNVVMHISRQGK